MQSNTMIAIICKEKNRSCFEIVNKGIRWPCTYDEWKQSRLLSIEYRISKTNQIIIGKIDKNSIALKNIGESIQGITPYDKYRVKTLN